jgi:rhodanese-related sulfurtransferase
MDTATNVPFAISIRALHDLLGTPAAPYVVDVRRRASFDMDPRILPAAQRREPEHVAEWAAHLPRDRTIVVYCAHGHEISRHVAATLAVRGFDARYLDGGIERWKATAAPTLLKRPSAGIPGDRPMETASNPGSRVIQRLGLSMNFPDDHAMLEHGMVVYDALHAWLRSAYPGTRDADLVANS